MILLTNPIALYGKKVTTDLATRIGPHTVDSYSYGVGLRYQVERMWSGGETEANIEMLFEEQADFNADVKQPHLSEGEYDETVEAEEYEVGAKYQPASDKTDFNNYYRRLEDIAPEYLESYVGNLVFTICRRSGGLKQFNSKHMEQPVLLSQGDDEGDFTELADLQLRADDGDWSLEVKQRALQRLPYVLKRLHNLSCYTGIHMLSYIVAFIKARDKNENMRSAGSQKFLKKNAVIEEGVFLCDKAGNIKKQVLVQNKNKRAEAAFNWICGLSTEYQAYYQDYLDLINYFDILNVELYEDDFTKYQRDFIDKLIVVTVTPNKQYDAQVYNAILHNSSTPIQSGPDEDPIESTINTFMQIRTLDEELVAYDQRRDSQTDALITKFATGIYGTYSLMYLGVVTESVKYKWMNGYLFYDNQLVVMSANILSDPDGPVFNDDRCLIHESGYCVQVSTLMNLSIIPLYSAYENLKNKISAKDPDYKYVEWMRIGI